ncbi:hypothetical protein DS901_00525 [Loktanella sp. D2R18]|nr:hypothetical protein DS901_00525 [Loktanella sp. D2R18]
MFMGPLRPAIYADALLQHVHWQGAPLKGVSIQFAQEMVRRLSVLVHWSVPFEVVQFTTAQRNGQTDVMG